MKKAIEFLRDHGFNVDDYGNIISTPDEDENLFAIIDKLEDFTMDDDHCYTIIKNKIEKIDC